MRQQMIKTDGEVACEATFVFGLFDIERRRLINPTPEWAYAVGLEPPPPRPGLIGAPLGDGRGGGRRDAGAAV